MIMQKAWLFIGVLAIAAGCRAPRMEESRPLTPAEANAFSSMAQDPRKFWITVYNGDSGPVFTGANRLHPEQMASLPFLSPKKTAAPLIRIDAGQGRSFFALVDTSSRESWMDFGKAMDIRVVPLGPPSYPAIPSHVSDQTPGYASVVGKIRFDQVNMETAIFHVRGVNGPLGFLTRHQDYPRPSAIIGCNMLQAFQFVQFDFPARLIIFSSTVDYTPNPEALVATAPLREEHGAYASDGMIDNDAGPIILDVAGDFEIAMNSPPTNSFRQVSFGDLVFRQIHPIAGIEEGLGALACPRIGRQLLSRFKMTIANKQKMIYFERPDSATSLSMKSEGKKADKARKSNSTPVRP